MTCAALPNGWLGIALVKPLLVPVRINRRFLVRRVETSHLIGRHRPADRSEVLFKLLLRASANHDIAHGRLACSMKRRPITRMSGFPPVHFRAKI